jgi:hypothetical protein
MFRRSIRSVLFAVVVALALLGGSHATPVAATGPTHTSCAGGATRAPEVGLPAPGPAFGPTIADVASSSGGLGDLAQQVHDLLCTPKS